MQLLLISASTLIASWMVTIFGLYFAVKYKEANKVRKSKLFYFVTMLGELFGEISWYMVVISIALIIARFLN